MKVLKEDLSLSRERARLARLVQRSRMLAQEQQLKVRVGLVRSRWEWAWPRCGGDVTHCCGFVYLLVFVSFHRQKEE